MNLPAVSLQQCREPLIKRIAAAKRASVGSKVEGEFLSLVWRGGTRNFCMSKSLTLTRKENTPYSVFNNNLLFSCQCSSRCNRARMYSSSSKYRARYARTPKNVCGQRLTRPFTDLYLRAHTHPKLHQMRWGVNVLRSRLR